MAESHSAEHRPNSRIAPPLTSTVQMTDTVQLYMPVISGPPLPDLLIAAAHIDSSVSNEPDEAILLWNVGERTQSLAGLQLATQSKVARFSVTTTLAIAPGARLWCAAEATAFRRSFGEMPGCEWKADTEPNVPNLDGSFTLVNSGGRLSLLAADGTAIDTLLYGNETDTATGWTGAPAQVYDRSVIPSSGQVWQRKRDPTTNVPIDTNRASDWAGDLADVAWGRRVRMPGWRGWDASDGAFPAVETAAAQVTVAVGPEGLYQPLHALFTGATRSIDLSIYTFEHPEMAAALVAALGRGVRVRMLLEGSPPGGIEDVQRWSVAQVAAAGGEVRYLAVQDDAPNGYRERYRYTHAKYGIIDGQQVLLGTDNFNYDSMPLLSADPVGGRRGFFLITDAAPVVSTLQALFESDWAHEHRLDLRPFAADHPKYGGPPPEFVFTEPKRWNVADAPFAAPQSFYGTAQFSVLSAPENALRPDAGILDLIGRAGAGDEIALVQLYEHKYWGESSSNPVADPNPRLQALIDAARRGARVRLLLDGYFDDDDDLRSNLATVEYVRTIAATERLNLEASLGNPTAGGIHAKVVLLRVGGEAWSAVGSLNGGEVSHKLNREVVLLTDMPDVYAALMQVFEWDWGRE